MKQIRKFGKERFTHYSTTHSKTVAENIANIQRVEHGYKARVVPVKRNGDNAYEVFRKKEVK